ncbi:methyltransferase family protein [Anthocerotibacter panamensis]|uniref:methyltransferase family protein n=1 Tax=Anthocerotibacter panamensis TaxID=2857077 RepID=UPI001C40172A|nr:isoprenylcysteine carboxylmethyltransferase family protein [Anthocerotibacter panamensis]
MRGPGTGWVIAQLLLLFLIMLLPKRIDLWPDERLMGILGALLLAAGAVVILLGLGVLRSNFTVFPRPRPEGELVTDGIYGLMRHPFYTGLILFCLGISFLTDSLIKLLLTVGLLVFLDAKARVEERWLEGRFPQYTSYRQQVKKFIPGIY